MVGKPARKRRNQSERGLLRRILNPLTNTTPFRSKRIHDEDDVCCGVVDLFDEEKHEVCDEHLAGSADDNENINDVDVAENSREARHGIVVDLCRKFYEYAISEDLSSRYKKIREEDARCTKLRKQASKLIEEDDLDGFLKLIKEENTAPGDDRAPVTFESPFFSDRDTNMTLLHSALEEDATKMASYLIENCSGEYLMKTYTNFNIQIPPSRKSCLHILAENGNLALVDLLLERLRKHYPVLHPSFQVLIHPIGKDLPLDKVKKFVNLQVVTKIKDLKRRMTAAHLAVVNEHHHLLPLMAKHEIELDAEDSNGDTPLMWAVQKGHLESFKALMKLGVNVNCVNKFHCCALHLAISNRQIEMAELLIDDPAVELNLERIKNPRWAVEMAASHNDVQLMKKLMEPINKVRICNANILDALFIASQSGHEEIIEEILKENDKLINAVDDVGSTPVMVATDNGKLSSVKILVEKFSADLSPKNNFRETVYDMAMKQSSIDILKYLMDQNKGNQVLSPIYLHSAAASGDTEKIDFIISSGNMKTLEPDDNDNTIFHTAAAHNAYQVLDYFLAKDDDLTDVQNRDGETPLHIAVKRGNIDCVKTLLAKNARIDVCDKRNQNPLHTGVASSSTGVEVISLLVERMKETYITLLNEQECDGNTALHLAALYGREELLEILADLDPEVENTDGETALHTVVKNANAKVVKALLKLFYTLKERNVDRKDEKGNTALMLSIEAGDAEKFELLLSYGADMTLRAGNGSTIMHEMISHNRRNLSNSDKFVAIYHSIVKCSVKWYCRKEGLRCPMDNTQDHFLYKMNAIRYLTSELYYDKCNALQFASKLGTGDLLKTMLRTPEVYKFTRDCKYSLPTLVSNHTVTKSQKPLRNFIQDPTRQGNVALHDVTHLIPMTEPKTSGPLVLEVNLHSETKVAQSETPKSVKSCLEFIVNTNDDNFINDILDDEPFRFLVSKYWTWCRRGYEVLMWLHVIYMILFTYFTMPTSDFLKTRFHPLNETSDQEILKSRYESVQLFGFLLVWPIFIISYEVVMLFYYISVVRKKGLTLNKSFFGKFRIGEITSGLMRVPVGMMLFIFDNLSHISSILFGSSTIAWFVMSIYCTNPHDYLESLAVVLIFGWLHTVNYVKGFKDWNAMASILKQILIKDITCFVYIYIFVLISFGYAIHALIQADYDLNPDYRRPTSTIYLTFYRMLSPGNILDISEDRDYVASGGRIVVLRSVCAAYSVISTVVLMNMLIAMMNSTYSEIKSNKSTAWRIDSLKMALWFEQKLPCLRKWNLLGFSAKLDVEQNRWYLSKETTINNDEVYWQNTKQINSESDDEDGDGDGDVIKKRIGLQKQFLVLMESLNVQVGLLREEMTGNSNDNRQIKTALSDMRMEIKRIHELSLETSTLSKLSKRLEEGSNKKDKH